MMKSGVLFVALLVFGLAGVAAADTITTTCPNADASTTCDFTLTYGLTTVAGPTDLVQITLTIDTADTASLTDVIRDVAFKVVSSDTDISGTPTLTTAPGSTGAWTVSVSGLNANGCSDTTSPGFVCATDSDTAPLDGSTYTWVFTMTILDGSLLTDPLAATVKALYCNDTSGVVGDGTTGNDCSSVNFLGLTSENITLQPVGGSPVGGETVGGSTGVPEPNSLTLIGTALLALAGGAKVLRRRSQG
jgi:hypothetical protein